MIGYVETAKASVACGMLVLSSLLSLPSFELTLNIYMIPAMQESSERCVCLINPDGKLVVDVLGAV